MATALHCGHAASCCWDLHGVKAVLLWQHTSDEGRLLDGGHQAIV